MLRIANDYYTQPVAGKVRAPFRLHSTDETAHCVAADFYHHHRDGDRCQWNHAETLDMDGDYRWRIAGGCRGQCPQPIPRTGPGRSDVAYQEPSSPGRPYRTT